MPETKDKRKCIGCGKSFSLKTFESTNAKGKFYRNTCVSCRRVNQNKNKSKTPEAYLKSLYVQLKSSRTKDNPELVFDIEVEDLIAVWNAQQGKCALTGLYMTYHKDGQGKKDLNVSIDRINPNIWYIPNNIQLVCGRVNILKHSLTEDLLYWWCKNIVEHKEN
jgi:hypothetical protein